MAYYGGAKSERPWPKMNIPIVALNAVMVVVCLFMAAALLNQPSTPLATTEVQGVETVETNAVFQKILVATQDISPGDKLHPSMFSMELRPINGIEEHVATEKTIIEEKFAGSFIVSGSPLLKPYINPTGTVSNAVTRQIPRGYRAVTIPVTNISGVEGWITPGSRVDVVWSTSHRGKQIVSIIVENAQVVSSGREANVDRTQVKDPNSIVKSITLIAPLKAAQKINLAKSSAGRLTLSLRGDEDADTVGSQITSLDGLIQARDLRLIDDVQGKVRIGRTDYLMKGGELVKSIPVNPDTANNKEPAKQ